MRARVYACVRVCTRVCMSRAAVAQVETLEAEVAEEISEFEGEIEKAEVEAEAEAPEAEAEEAEAPEAEDEGEVPARAPTAEE